MSRYYIVNPAGNAINLVQWDGTGDLGLAPGYAAVLVASYAGLPWPQVAPADAQAAANDAALHRIAENAIGQLDQADTLLGSPWDSLTPAQRTAIMRGLVRGQRALIRIVLAQTDSAS